MFIFSDPEVNSDYLRKQTFRGIFSRLSAFSRSNCDLPAQTDWSHILDLFSLILAPKKFIRSSLIHSVYESARENPIKPQKVNFDFFWKRLRLFRRQIFSSNKFCPGISKRRELLNKFFKILISKHFYSFNQIKHEMKGFFIHFFLMHDKQSKPALCRIHLLRFIEPSRNRNFRRKRITSFLCLKDCFVTNFLEVNAICRFFIWLKYCGVVSRLRHDLKLIKVRARIFLVLQLSEWNLKSYGNQVN